METREIKITRETAERWYNGNDKELKELALQTYPELKPKYEVGKWYKGENGILFRCQEYGKSFGYGFGIFHFDINRTWFAENFTEATHEEVEQRFKEEAKKRGYYDEPFVCLYYKKVNTCECVGSLSHDMDKFWTPQGCVFDNGKWAKFVKEPEYKIGEVYAFADDEEKFQNGNFIVSELIKIDNTDDYLPFKSYEGWHSLIRKIEYKFVD